MSFPWTPYKTWVTGEVLTAGDLNTSFITAANGGDPTSINDYSATTTQMRLTADPYPASVESLATTLDGELQRMRFALLGITGKTYWYQPPDATIANFFSGTTTFAGAKTFSTAVTITPVTNQLVLGATRTVTITAPTPASSARTWTLPDLSTSPTFAALEGTQTFTGTKNFSLDVTVTSGTGTSFLAQASTNGGAVGMFIDNTSNTASSDAKLALRVAGTSANDPYIAFNISGSTQWSIGTDNSDSDNWKLSQSSALGTNDTLIATTGGDVYTVAYTDYSGTSTIVGWTSFTSKLIYYKKIGKQVWVWVTLNGTSNSTSTTFTLPYTSSNDSTFRGVMIAVDNSVTTAGRYNLPPNSATVTCATDLTGTGWTASGTKAAIFQFTYQTV